MWDSIVVAVIIAVCFFFVGRKMYHQFKAASDPTINLGCGCGCSGGCSPSSCVDDKNKKGK
jgi:hypothetical protein